jgi:hypothetical protein
VSGLVSPTHIRLVDFSIFGSHREDRLMAVLKGYLDDSLDDQSWSIGGYIGSDYQWKEYARRWNRVMHDHGVPWLHMKEMGEKEGTYKKWQPREQHQKEVRRFFQGHNGRHT